MNALRHILNCRGCGRATIERHADGRWYDYGTDHPHTCGITASGEVVK